VARSAQPPSPGARRSWLIALAATALVIGVVSARAAESIHHLHATRAATTPAQSMPTAPARTRSPISKARPAKRLAALRSRLAATVDDPRDISVAAVDLSTGRHFDYGVRHGMIDASVSKLDVLEALLLHHQDTHTPLAGQDAELATAMIEHSDNEAGQLLWNELGYATGIRAANARLGLRHTVPDPAGYYGLTTSSARDQLVLLENLTRRGPLTPRSRAYALELLREVEADQRWGVSAAADPGSSVAVKNGWMPMDDDTGPWVVNSDGIVTVGSHRLLIAIMTRHDPDEQHGIRLIAKIAREVAAALV
jgi:beta-lactamase class A